MPGGVDQKEGVQKCTPSHLTPWKGKIVILRLSLEEKEAWVGYAGRRQLSAWLRGLANKVVGIFPVEEEDEPPLGPLCPDCQRRVRVGMRPVPKCPACLALSGGNDQCP